MASIQRVIEEGLCSGCGACSFAAPDLFGMARNRLGAMAAQKLGAGEEPDSLRLVCPFSGEGSTETEIAAREWPDLPEDDRIGRHARTIACHVTDDDLRMAGGSGGLVTWIALELLRQGEVDGVLHVQPQSGPEADLFAYDVSQTGAQIRNGAKSRYYSVTMAGVLAAVQAREGRFAVIGVPCFITATRKLVETGVIDRARLPYMIGLVCGHMKSRHFADYLAWQKGVAPGRLEGFDFRAKLLDRPASQYGFRLQAGGCDEVHPMSSVRGRDWGEGMFKLQACEFCDDVLAECADVAVGDAWLPGHVDDPKGTNVAVIRNERIAALVARAAAGGALHVEDIPVSDVVRSQASGLRHRREGLAHRLARRARAGLWVPRKRVAPALAPEKVRRRVYDLRLKLALASNEVFAETAPRGDLAGFEARMAPLLRDLRIATKGGLRRLVLGRLARGPRKALALARQMLGRG